MKNRIKIDLRITVVIYFASSEMSMFANIISENIKMKNHEKCIRHFLFSYKIKHIF